MAVYTPATSLVLTLLLLLLVPGIDSQWSFIPQQAGHFNSHKDHNLGGSVAYQGEKNSFKFGAHSSAHPSGAETQAFHGASSTVNKDGSNLQVRGVVQDSSFGPAGYKQHTDTVGDSYTSPSGINFDVQHSQSNNNFGYKHESNQIGIGHTFRNGLKVNAGYSQSRDNNGHKNEGIGATCTLEYPF